MVIALTGDDQQLLDLSVLALSSRFDGLHSISSPIGELILSVLALSSRFDGPSHIETADKVMGSFSTRSVESF